MTLTFRRLHDPLPARDELVEVPTDRWPRLRLAGLVDDNGVHAVVPLIDGAGYHSGRPAVIDAATCRAWGWALLSAANVLETRNRRPPTPPLPDPQLSIYDALDTPPPRRRRRRA